MILDIKNEKGLHARASAKFVEIVEGFEADARCETSQMLSSLAKET